MLFSTGLSGAWAPAIYADLNFSNALPLVPLVWSFTFCTDLLNFSSKDSDGSNTNSDLFNESFELVDSLVSTESLFSLCSMVSSIIFKFLTDSVFTNGLILIGSDFLISSFLSSCFLIILFGSSNGFLTRIYCSPFFNKSYRLFNNFSNNLFSIVMLECPKASVSHSSLAQEYWLKPKLFIHDTLKRYLVSGIKFITRQRSSVVYKAVVQRKSSAFLKSILKPKIFALPF